MATTNPQPDDGPVAPLLPFSGIESGDAFDLPYAEEPQAHGALPPPPAALPPPPTAPLPAAPPVVAAAPPPPTPATWPTPPVSGGAVPADDPAPPDPGPPDRATLREPRPFLPPNFSAPGTAKPAPGVAHQPTPERTPAPMPPPLSAQPLSGPVITVGPEDEHETPVEPGPATPLPPMVAARTFETEPASPSTDQSTDPFTGPAPTHQPAGGAEPTAAPGSIAADATGGGTTRPPILPARPGAAPPTAPGPIVPVATEGPGPVPMGPLTMSPEAPFPAAPMAPPAPVVGPSGLSSIPPLVPGAPAPVPPHAVAASGAVEPGSVRVADGILVGMAAAALAGGVWWAVVALSARQFPYLAVLLGLLVGQGVLIGSRRGSLALGALAGVLTLGSLSIAQYFISRSLAISELGLDLPLWEGAGAAADVIRAAYQDDALTAMFVVLAAGCAAVAAGRSSARPVH